MSSFSSYIEDLIYRWMLRATNMPSAPTNIYLALFTSDPQDNGSGNEVSGGNYARELIAFDTPTSIVGTGTSGSNSSNIIFTTATADWGSITHGALFDALSGGNLLSYWPWAVAKLIQTGDTYTVAAGDITALIR